VADIDKERSLFESLLLGLSKPGSLARQAIVHSVEGKRNLGDFSAIMEGSKEVTPDDLFTSLENKFGVDLTPGPKEWDEKSGGEKAATFARDLVTDIFTSPDSLIGAPAKLLQASKLVVNPTTARAVTGATLGYLSSDQNDDMIDTAQKMALGAATFGKGGAVLKSAGRAAGRFGERAILDPIVESFNEGALQKIRAVGNRMSFSGASRVSKAAQSKIRRKETEFFETFSKLDEKFVESLQRQGATPQQIQDGFARYDSLMGLGEGRVIRTRKLFKRMIKAINEQDVTSLGEAVEEMKPVLSEIGAADTIENIREYARVAARDLGPTASDQEIGKVVTTLANDLVETGMIRQIQTSSEPFARQIGVAVGRHVDANKKLVEKFNQFALDKLNSKDLDYTFTPLGYHKTDLRTIDEVADEAIAAATRPGARQRLTDEVVESVDGISREQAREIGAGRYARLFLTKHELDARQVLGTVAKNLRESKDPIISLLRGYDGLLNTMKSIYLTTGASWVVNTFSDNLLRAYMASGPVGAGRTLLRTTEQLGQSTIRAGGVAADAAASFLSGQNVDRVTKAINALDNDSLYKKMFNAYDPGKTIKRLDYNDDLLNAAAELRVIEQDKFADFLDMANSGEALLNVTKGTKQAQEIMGKAAQGGIEGIADRMNKLMWDTGGRIGSSLENTARYTVFDEVLKSLYPVYPDAKKAIDRFGYMRILRAENLKGIAKNPSLGKGVRQARRAMKEAASIVQDTFFDYSDVNRFEKHVVKRILPFWTFFSRNAEFWLDKLGDPNAVGRAAKAESVSAALGQQPTEDQRLGLPNYLLEKGVRLRGDKALTMPSLSIVDAAEIAPIPGNITNALRGIGQRLAPLPKEAIQQGFNIDLFTGGPLTPTADRPRKRIFESAATLLPDSILEKAGIFRDNEGRLYTNSEIAARTLSALRSNLPIPGLPLLDATARAMLETQFRELTPREATFKQLSPVKSREITPAEFDRERRRTIRNLQRLEGGREEVLGGRRRKAKKIKLKRAGAKRRN
jgi:hypothetical protein